VLASLRIWPESLLVGSEVPNHDAVSRHSSLDEILLDEFRHGYHADHRESRNLHYGYRPPEFLASPPVTWEHRWEGGTARLYSAR
jgi:hypothetical protein